MNEPTNLADRYRRLLAWYPKDHRERHGEEMLGVLLAGAGERDRPSRKETADLVRGAVYLHLRRVVGIDGGIDHRDVLAIVSLLGPIVLLAGSAPVLDRMAAWFQVGVPRSRLMSYLQEIPAAPVWALWAVVAVLSLFRLRRTAAVGAWLATLGFLPASALGYNFFWDSMVITTGWILLGVVVAAALTWSPGPARGWELVGGRRVVVLVAAVGTSLVMVMKSLGTYDVLFHSMAQVANLQGVGRMALWFLALAVLVAGAVVAGGVRTREGRRAALMLCVPVVVSVLLLVLPRNSDLLTVAVLCYGIPVVVLLGLGGVPVRRRAGAR
ncbi:MAG: hypothetical protein WBA97_13140 [Actinophytocola sp.]|uniref:hypothetical protein n=1 Tax=Actinophytocola sp. TaxID=1872138 RepID=UPI003C76F2F7